MNISEEFNHNIIIHATGKYQIQLLALIYANINKNYNKNFKFHNEDWYDKFDIINDFVKNLELSNKKNNTKTNYLYCPNSNSSKADNYTIHSKNNLEKFIMYGIDKNTDSYITSLKRKVDLKEYKLINMRTFLNMYGKYLFNDIDDYNRFINKYSVLEHTNIFKTIKEICY